MDLPAISLTYDDAMNGHLDSAIGHLQQFNLRGTFYVDGVERHHFFRRAAEWAKVAAAGHEIGNHTRHHPCRGNANRDLRLYTLEQICEEIADFEEELSRIVGKSTRSFAYPCCHITVGPDDKQVSYSDFVETLFPAARGGGNRADHPSSVNLMNVGSLTVREGVTLDATTAHIDACIDQGLWCVLMFHGVGEGWLVADLPTHLGICQHIAKRVDEGKARSGVFVEIAQRIRQQTNRPWPLATR